MAKMRPKAAGKKPTAPTAPKKPTTATGSKRHVSTTNDPRCTQAMSLLQKAIKAGQKPTSEVNAALAMCRNRSRRRIDRESRMKRLEKIRDLRSRGKRGEALQEIRGNRRKEQQRGESARLLRAMREMGRVSVGRASTIQSNARGTDRLNRGAEIFRQADQKLNRQTRYRVNVRAGLQEQRQPRAAATPETPPKKMGPPREPMGPQRSAWVDWTPAQRSHARSARRDREQNQDVRSRSAAALRELRRFGPAGRERARQVRAFVRGTSIAHTRDRYEGPALQVQQRQNDAARGMAIAGHSRAGLTETLLREGRHLNQEEINRFRTGARDLITDWRMYRAATRASGGRLNPNDSTNMRNVANYIRASTTRGVRSNAIGRNIHDMAIANARTSLQRQNAASSTSSSSTRSSSTSSSSTRSSSTRRAASAPPPSPTLPSVTTVKPARRPPQQQINEARTQSGYFTDYHTQTYSAGQRRGFVDEAERMGLSLHGRTPDEKFGHLVALSGLPAELGYTARIDVYGDQIVVKSHLGRLSRTISKTNGVIKIHNNYFVPDGVLRTGGYAQDFYARQVLAARAAGVSFIDVDGGGRGQGDVDTSGQFMTGYHVWPEYGFDYKLQAGDPITRIWNAHPDLMGATHISQVLFHPNPEAARAGRDVWRMHGTSLNTYVLNITDLNSTSYTNFKANYKKRRGVDLHTTNAKTNASKRTDYSGII